MARETTAQRKVRTSNMKPMEVLPDVLGAAGF
jgi:hypothetical protein